MDKIKIYILLIILFTRSLATENHVSANGAKPSEYPSENSSIFFDENPNISLIEETILFSNIQCDRHSYSNPVAKVSIDYNLQNLDAFDKNFIIFFIVPQYTGDFSIIMNDTDITESCITKIIPLPANWKPSNVTVLNPESQEEILTYFNDEETNNSSRVSGMEIPVSMKSNEYATLHIEYESFGGYYSARDIKNTIYSFMYYLTPAKFWSGSPRITLKVELPINNKYSFYSNIPLERNENGCYETVLTDIPDSEWSFSFNSKEGLIYGTNNPSIHS